MANVLPVKIQRLFSAGWQPLSYLQRWNMKFRKITYRCLEFATEDYFSRTTSIPCSRKPPASKKASGTSTSDHQNPVGTLISAVIFYESPAITIVEHPAHSQYEKYHPVAASSPEPQRASVRRRLDVRSYNATTSFPPLSDLEKKRLCSSL